MIPKVLCSVNVNVNLLKGGKGSDFQVTIQPGQALLMPHKRKYRKIASCRNVHV